MNADDPSLFEWAFKGMVTVVLTVGGWLWVMLIRAVVKNKDEMAEHRLHVSQTYASKEDVSQARAETNDTLKRIHARIDSIFDLLQGRQR